MATSTRDMKGDYPDLERSKYNKANNSLVTIHLSDVDCNEQFSDRILSLTYPDFCVTVGRGSQSDENIEPAPDNAWFSSRVMSRQHALIRADPYDQILTIQDDASMHGTFLNGDRVGKERVDLIPGDILTFGTEVVRGDDTYQPLKVSIYYDWEEGDQEKDTTAETAKDTSASTSTAFRNKFTVDFSEEDFDSDFDDDVQIVRESAREQSVEFLSQVDAPTTQLHQSTNSCARQLPVSALMTTTSVPEETAATKMNLISGQPKLMTTAEEDDESDIEHNPSSPYYTDDEDESELDTDSFNEESDFVEETTKEDEHEVQIEKPKVTSVFQSAQVSTSSSKPADCDSPVPLDTTEREPSPSDAALARPRLALPPVPPAPKPTSGIPVPPLSSTQNSTTHPYYTPFDKYDYNHMYYPSANPSSRPSHSFVNPYSYNSLGSSVCSMGALNSYPPSLSNHPWDAARFTIAAAQPPRPTTRFGLPTSGSPTYAFPNPVMTSTVDQPSRSTTSSSSSDNLRGKKRKVDEMSNFSEDEAVDSTPETTPSKTISCEQSSPAPLPMSKITESVHVSTDTVEMSDVERESSLEVEEALEQADAFMKELQERVDQAQNQIVREQQRVDDQQHDKVENHIENLPESDAQAENSEERLRKKRKITPREGVVRPSLVSTTLKYTATALAGATVGVLGTVIGLASLPTDYFV